MFNKKPRRNFRQRKDSSSDNEDQQKNSEEAQETEKVSAVVNKLHKEAQSRGISCSSKREATPPKPDSSETEDVETLEETEKQEERKKDNDGNKIKANAILSFSDDKEAGESTFKLKKSSEKAVLFQVRKREPAPAKTTHSKGGGDVSSYSPRQDCSSDDLSPSMYQNDDDEEDDDDDDDDGDNDDNNGYGDDKDSDGSSVRSPSASSDASSSAAKPVVIPNAKAIEAARRQRRATRAQKEYIPLGRDGQSSAGSTPDHYSREGEDDRVIDDDDDEPDDYERRIAFAPRLKSVRERIAEKLGESDDSLSGSDADEQELWEETQILKGVKRQPGEQSPSGSESSSYSSSRLDKGTQKKRSKGLRIPKSLPPVSVAMVKRKIAGKLDSMKEVYRARQAELRRMEGDTECAKTSLEKLEESSSERQLKFYRTMTLYVHNLVECLQEKVVEVNFLEVELHTLLSDHMEELLAQRRVKIKEQADHLQQLSYNTDEQSRSTTSGTETPCNTGTTLQSEEEPEDTQPSLEEEEQLQKKMADIMLRSQAVFSDVQEDFCSVKKILSRFEEWRGFYSESYHNAYISLCLPKLLNPIIRHQLLAWNPLKDVSGDFENLPWFSAVETFCHGHGHEELEHLDRQMLSNVIEKTVLPKITAYVDLVWDPLSRQQSVCLSDVCHRLKEDYSIFEGEQSKPVKALMEAVVRRLRSCVDEDIFIPLYPKKFLDDMSSPQRHFRDQQFWTAVKLLGNLGKWDSLLPESILKELMLDKLLNRYLMITLSSHTLSDKALSACKKIADSLPLSWFKGQTECLPQLQNFRNHLVETAHTICKQQPPKDPNTKSAVVEVLQVLSTIRCHDSIMAMTQKYNYEDVIYSHQLLNQETEDESK